MRIVVAMSGGVDSSVVAGLMHEAGHEVIGITLQLYDQGAGSTRRGACCAGRDIDDARAVADRLGFAHYVIDAQARFRAAVIDNFTDSYAAGETPIPCVRCNQSVKFTDLLALAQDLGAEALATGHYAQRIDGATGAELHQAADPARDQSFFLFATTQAQLDFCRFPLGAMASKADVRAHAARLGLAVADKPDSQDICFVPTGSYADLVATLRPEAARPGDIVSRDGRVLGRHEGVFRYTVGQAKRLGDARADQGEPQVVVALDPGARRVIVGPRDAGVTSLVLRETNWLSAPAGTQGIRCGVKLRARDTLRPAMVRTSHEGRTEVTLDGPALPAPGQGCVMYGGARVLGGGFIAGSPTL